MRPCSIACGRTRRWAGSLGYEGVQLPSWDSRLFNPAKAAQSDAYCDEVMGIAGRHGIEITDLSTHLQGQLVAVHPAFDEAFDGFAAPEIRGRPQARTEWAIEQMRLAARASRRLGLSSFVTFSELLAGCLSIPGRSGRRVGGDC